MNSTYLYTCPHMNRPYLHIHKQVHNNTDEHAHMYIYTKQAHTHDSHSYMCTTSTYLHALTRTYRLTDLYTCV